MDNKIECKWGRNSEFSRKVIAHFILKENPEYIDVIDEKVEKWFSDFEGSTYEGDCLTTNKFANWFESYFIDLGCNSKHILPYVKDFLQCFPEEGTSIYAKYKERITGKSLNSEDFLHYVPHFTYKEQYTRYAYDVFSNIIPINKDLFFDYDRAIEIIQNFDNDFDWISEYIFNAKWKMVFCLVVDFMYICNRSEIEKNKNNKYDQVAGAFLNKYMYRVFEEFDRDFKRLKIQVDGVTMSVDDFEKKLFDCLNKPKNESDL